MVLPFEPRFSFLAFVFLAFAIVRDGFTALPTLDVRDAESRLLSRDAPAAYSRITHRLLREWCSAARGSRRRVRSSELPVLATLAGFRLANLDTVVHEVTAPN